MALSFTASTDLVQISNARPLSGRGTVAFWLLPSFNSGDSTNRFLWAWADTAAGNASARCQIQRFSDNNIYAGPYKFDGTTDERLVIADTGIFTSGTWVHLALIWSTANTTTTFYVNGTQKSTSAAHPVTYNQSCKVVALGNAPSAWGSNGVANAVIAEFGLWSAPLTPGEIYSLAFGARVSTVRRVYVQQLNWRLDGYGAPALDTSTFNQNGTLTGTTFAPGPPFLNAAPVFPGVPLPADFLVVPPPPPVILMPQIVT